MVSDRSRSGCACEIRFRPCRAGCEDLALLSIPPTDRSRRERAAGVAARRPGRNGNVLTRGALRLRDCSSPPSLCTSTLFCCCCSRSKARKRSSSCTRRPRALSRSLFAWARASISLARFGVKARSCAALLSARSTAAAPLPSYTRSASLGCLLGWESRARARPSVRRIRGRPPARAARRSSNALRPRLGSRLRLACTRLDSPDACSSALATMAGGGHSTTILSGGDVDPIRVDPSK